ncbi:hypothetical protein ANRL4_05170 [Anaerolineae bacterium]|nr:hypothetical protein ANRL4_05170 [Anaerolineae bacterium]
MVYAVIGDAGKSSVCLPGFKTIAAFWFATIVFLKIISLLFTSLASLFLLEPIFEMSSSGEELLSIQRFTL